ncbi:hydrogenase maturation nickel metallochaperone HypA [Puniceicoccales bacterium CK1056]|uniref:Hydrogenase maturation factor HypA n=1 Tax=Oceanipulchritudo coccoides TaxID=2706888 RepID=A0A6B2M456_9BACT|nr:hydrogenase maturation nickel metallochaperone HypA [Oceanipulchritudo coccoides]NDV63082.1 hydrogenase maturation nickel metallochaperone HypA [Oceanipulchritudo coccoides]
MHELGIAESALKAAIVEMEKQKAIRILSLTLRIGELAAVDPQAMEFAFKTVTLGTPAEGATLEIDHVAPIAWCRDCSESFSTDSIAFFKCPRCGNYSGELKQGREIELARLELDS